MLFHEINYLLFESLFDFDRNIGFSRHNVQCLYLIFLILRLWHSYYKQVEMDIVRFSDDDRRNLNVLHDYILIKHDYILIN